MEVQAPAKIRWQRVIKRGKIGEEKISFSRFIALEKKELSGCNHNQQLNKTCALAKEKILNNGTLKKLEE